MPAKTKNLNSTADAAPLPQTHVKRVAERVAMGKALRKHCSRHLQAEWQAPAKRADPIELLIENSQGRMKELIPIRYGCMLASPFGFYRGAVAIMAYDLAHTPATGLNLQIWGDCHLLNFGGFAAAERRLIFDINDFDETSIAPNRFDTRRQLVITEANAIDTTFLRAGYLGEPYRTEIRQFLREYGATRLAPTRDASKLVAAVARSEEIQTELWSRAEALAIAYPSTEVVALFIDSLNEVINLHTERVVAVFNRIPTNFWLVIFFMAFLTLTIVGFQNGQTGSRNLIAVIVLILVFAAVIQLNLDLDRSQEGFLQVSQQAMINVVQMMSAAKP